MNYAERFVLPFRWREFGSWFSSTGNVSSENESGRLKINGIGFAAGSRKLEGIRVKVGLELNNAFLKNIYVCAFLADLHQKELFEPFIGNPERFGEEYIAGKSFRPRHHGANEELELFIPEQGWILPSIWRFLVQSIGLRNKGAGRMPDVAVFVFQPGCRQPLLFASQPFDYFGNAQQLKEDLVLGDFFNLLKLPQDAHESEVQRAYIMSCRDHQDEITAGQPPEVVRRNSARFSRIKQGYHVWIEKLQRRNRLL
jgi:hypothetical protein